jgi:SAM-dependent methyltransferase
MINFNHEANTHGLNGAIEALKLITPLLGTPSSVLDVGCGYGFWLKAAEELYKSSTFGIDGIDIQPEYFQINKDNFKVVDLNKAFDLNQSFDLLISLEVAEHLSPGNESEFINSLVKHSDLILFSAAIPNQKGDHHINCHWPVFWQNIFNSFGFECSDNARWEIWENENIEPWYCQNLFIARKSQNAGNEPRIRSIVHPRMINHIRCFDTEYYEQKVMENGYLANELKHLKNANQGILRKIKRRLIG